MRWGRTSTVAVTIVNTPEALEVAIERSTATGFAFRSAFGKFPEGLAVPHHVTHLLRQLHRQNYSFLQHDIQHVLQHPASLPPSLSCISPRLNAKSLDSPEIPQIHIRSRFIPQIN